VLIYRGSSLSHGDWARARARADTLEMKKKAGILESGFQTRLSALTNVELSWHGDYGLREAIYGRTRLSEATIIASFQAAKNWVREDVRLSRQSHQLHFGEGLGKVNGDNQEVLL
jgi:hypothetical protein